MSVENALQKAIVAKLRLDNVVAGDRVYDKVPPLATFPYVHIRGMQSIEDGADCIDGQEVFIDIDVWSNEVGKSEAASLASAVRLSLNFAALVLDDPYALLEISHRDTQVETGDGLLTRARMSFSALVE